VWLAVTLMVSAPATLADGMMTGYCAGAATPPLSCSARSTGAPVMASAKATVQADEASSNGAAPTSAAVSPAANEKKCAQ
jgi:hypothetical protein